MILIIFVLIVTYVPLNIVRAQTVTGTDWSSYRHDPAGTGYAVAEIELVPPLEQADILALGSALTQDNSPIVVGGYIIVVEENGLCAYRVEDKTLAWCYSELDEIEISSAVRSEIHAAGIQPESRTVSLVTLDFTRGTILGQVDLGRAGSDGFACSAVEEEHVYCTIGATLTSVDVTAQEIVWSIELDASGVVPVVLGDTVFAPTGLSVYAVNVSNGGILWNVTQPAGTNLRPIVFDSTLVVGGKDGNFYGLDTATGAPKWVHILSAGDPCPAAYGNGNLVVSTSVGVLEKLDPANGELLWTYYPGLSGLETCPAPAMANGYVYSGYVGGSLRAVDIETGTEAWSHAIIEGTYTGLAISDGNLVMPVSPVQIAFYSTNDAEIPTDTPEIPTITPKTIETEVPLSTLFLASISPQETTPGDVDITITAMGTGFSSTATLMWETTPLVTTCVDDTLLTAVVPANLLADPGVFELTVVNPEPDYEVSNSFTFSTVDYSPELGEQLYTKKTDFDWDDIPGAVFYKIQLSLSSDFSTLVFKTKTATSDYSYETNLLTRQTYYWRIKTWDGTAWSDWLPTWYFYSIDPPLAPVLVSPKSGVNTNHPTLLFSWDPVEKGDYYRIEISPSSTFTPTIKDIMLDPGILTYTAENIVDGHYYWRVRAYDAMNVKGAWSSVWTFKVDTFSPAAPVLMNPLDAVIVHKTTPTLKVGAVSGAKYYHFQVSSEYTFETLLVDNDSVTTTSSTASYSLQEAEALPFGTMYWRARTIDAAGNTSTWTVARSLVVNILKTPADGSYATTKNPVFTWGTAAGALQYQLQVSITGDFDLDPLALDISLPPSTTYTPEYGLAYGKYYWRMRVETLSGWGNWTLPYLFTITASVPKAPALSAPFSNILISNSTPKFRWVESFNIYAPQLRIKNRLIQVYLPPDYNESGKSYPVIYLHDGVQMFNSPDYNEYGVDETLDKLVNNGLLEGVIAVGIDHSDNRWDEFSPWVNRNMDRWFAWNAESVEGGEGDAYLDFIIDTLKPEIDKRYRTLSDRENTAIGGGSMGGIISIYAGLRNPEVFSKVVAFSPVLWFGETSGAWLSDNQIINYIKKHPVSKNVKFFVYIGTSECEGRRIDVYDSANRPVTYPQVLLEGTQVLVQTLKAQGVPTENINFIVNPGGVHQPYLWGWYVDDALLWFFEDQVLPFYEPPLIPPAKKGTKIEGYEIQISKNSTFTKIVQTGLVKESISYIADELSKDGKYYWRVRPINDLDIPGGWTETRDFTLDTTPPAVPELVKPLGGAIVQTTTPILIVKAVSDAKLYQFQVAEENTFMTLLIDKSVKTTLSTATCTLVDSQALPFGALYWRVRTVDQLGNASAWSEVRSMIVNIMKTPTNGSISTSLEPTFTWGAAAGALKYGLQLSNTSDFETLPLLLDVKLAPSTSYTPLIAPLDYGKYFWRMQVKTTAGWGNWTPIYSFIVSTKPETPVLIDPLPGSIVTSNTPVLNWSVVDDAVVSIKEYELQISWSNVFTPLVQSATVTGSSYTATTLGDGIYYWRVRAINELGVHSKWSPYWSFTVDTTP